MTGIVYITLSGRAEWATYNSLWAVLRHSSYIPDRVVILTFPEDLGRAEASSKRMAALLEAYGSTANPEVVTLPDSSLADITSPVKDIIDPHLASGDHVTLDLTNGRKLMALAVMRAEPLTSFAHVFYLYIRTLEDVDHPYMCIPKSWQTLYDLKEGWHA